jgi:hypothetical protein
MKNKIIVYIKSVTARKIFYRINLFLHSFALHGIGINNGGDD